MEKEPKLPTVESTKLNWEELRNKLEEFGHVNYKVAQERLINHEVYGYHCDRSIMPEDLTLPLVEDYP